MNQTNVVDTPRAPAATESTSPSAPLASRRRVALRAAEEMFSVTGLNGTPMSALAKTAGVSERALCLEFGDKTNLFREVVKINIQKRLRELDQRLSVISSDDDWHWVALVFEATILAGLSGHANAVLINWALLEDPEFAADLHRGEVGSVASLWERELARRTPEPVSRVVRCHLGMMFPIYACLSYGLWLVALGHNEESARPLARQFSADLTDGASTILRTRLHETTRVQAEGSDQLRPDLGEARFRKRCPEPGA